VTRIISILTVLLVALPTNSNAYNDRLYYPYAAPYRGHGFYYHPYADLEVSRLRRDLRERRIIDNANQRRQEQEVNVLRQQAFANHQVGARQACYYRSTGGFELCADLFGDEKQELAECESLVVQRNPGCNEPLTTDAR
jgi:regulator of replication initiation timing